MADRANRRLTCTLSINPDAQTPEAKKMVNDLLDAEIEEFSHWMATLADIRARGPLMNAEKALLKTYLIQKLKETF